jgi:hypothetical protein
MKAFAIFLIIFWIIVIIFPQIIAYLLWWLFILIWLNILIFVKKFKSNKESYVKFGNYKIFR